MGVTQRQTWQLQPRLLREWVPGSSLLQKPIQTFSSSKSTPPKLHEEQDGRVKDQAELPRGLRGVDQQADQHGILCLVRLSFYEFLVQPGRSSPPRICCSFQERVWGGTRPRHEADGIPDKERAEGLSSRTSPSQPPWSGGLRLRPWRLPLNWRKRCTRAPSTCTRWPEIRATAIFATSSSPSTSA